MSKIYLLLFIFLCLSGISCKTINITKMLPLQYGSSSMNVIAREIRRTISSIERVHLGKASFITVLLPPADDNTLMVQVMEETVQTLGSNWLITTNDSFCRESYEARFFVPTKTVIEYSADFYIIPLRKKDGLICLDAQLNLLSESNSFNPRGVFLLVTLTNQCDYKDNNTSNLYFNQMWSKNCMSSIILVLSECDFKISIVTATPFSDKNICRKVQENGIQQFHTKRHEEVVDVGIFKSNNKNFNKCLFTVGTIPQPPFVVGKPYKIAKETHYKFVGGVDLDLLNSVSTIYNFTYVFDVHHGYDASALGRVLPNGSFVGMFFDVVQKNLDISIGGIVPSDINYFRYAYSSYYRFSFFGWVVNDASLAPAWTIFFGAFSQDVWIISGLVFLITSFLYSFVDSFANIRPTKNGYNWAEKICFYCNIQEMPVIQYFSITLSLPSILNPKLPSLRMLYFSWSIYSMHMCIAYTSMLFLLISNPPLEKEIQTVEDLHKSGLKVCSFELVFQRFASTELDSTTRKIMDNNVYCSNWKTCIEDLTNHKNFSLLITQDALEYYVNTKQSKIHGISEAFFSYGAIVLTSKGSPLGPGFDKVILSAFQSGLVEKWFRVAKSRFSSTSNTDGSNVENKSATVLTVNDLKGAFFVLVVGICISSLLLVGELMLDFLQRKSCLHHTQAH